MKRYDERDTIFSRMSLKKGTKEYQYYYNGYPELEDIDNKLRNMPELGSPDTPTFDPIEAKIPESNFKFLDELRKMVEFRSNKPKEEVNPAEFSKKIKDLALYFGAKHSGITKMNDYHYYSYRGRIGFGYGEKIVEHLDYGLAFTVEMKRESLDKAPGMPELIESSRAYIEAAVIGMQLAYFIKELGYNARVHIDKNYLVLVSLVAYDAGLGVFGRSGLLITPDFGPAVRIGVVTTDLPLIPDEKPSYRIENFCSKCRICSSTCPGRAIPSGEKKLVNGDLRWQIDHEKCYEFWRKIGTDCGICMKNCPFGNGIDLRELNENEYSKNPELLLEKYLSSRITT
ncbi:MAG: reductive dehalogenase domain-containing protein [Kosmotogaceae bacterium]